MDNFTFSQKIAIIAQKSLLYEVLTTPKPGLVDINNSGAHKDMDIFTFVDSACALYPYFYECCLAGLKASSSEKELFLKLRSIGIVAEKTMLDATNGVNTHKGAIFSLGIICGAIGFSRRKFEVPSSSQIFETSMAMTRDVLLEELADIRLKSAPKTFGEKVFIEKGISGIRGEVANGFPTVHNFSLPFLKKLLNDGLSLNDSAALTLLKILLKLEDTNVLKRGNESILAEMRSDVLTIFHKLDANCIEKKICSDEIFRLLTELDAKYSLMRISPGGCADLLAVTLMVYFYEASGFKA